jgi:RNA polymerase sigma factor (TIGR02999 family)
MSTPGDVTQLLNRWVDGDAAALDQVTPLVYAQLRQIARQLFRRERESHTLQPTALVHEAFVRLIGVKVEWQNRAHFFAIAARMMRRLLVNEAQARLAEKRGGGLLRITLDDNVGQMAAQEGVLELDAALSRLAENDPRKSDVLELHYFGGLTHEEIATAMAISESTVRRELRVAKLWLRRMLSENPGTEASED